mgnify:CR=1 FL=1
MKGLLRPGEPPCATRADGEGSDADPGGDVATEFKDTQKPGTHPPSPMKDVRSSVGHERGSWRLAMQVEVDSLRDNQSFEVSIKTAPLLRVLPT